MKRMMVCVSFLLLGFVKTAWGNCFEAPPPEPVNIGIWFLRTDSKGDTLWTRIYCEEDQYPYNPTFARQTSDGGYIIIGGFFDDEIHDFYGKKFWLIKISKTGWMKWCEIYDVPPYENSPNATGMPSYVTETPNRGYLIESSWRPRDMGFARPMWFVEVDSVGTIVAFNEKSALTTTLTKAIPFFSKYNPSAKVEYSDYCDFFRGGGGIGGRKKMYIIEEDAIVEVRDTCLHATDYDQRCTTINLIRWKEWGKPMWSKNCSLGEPIISHFVGLAPDKGFIILASVSFPRE